MHRFRSDIAASVAGHGVDHYLAGVGVLAVLLPLRQRGSVSCRQVDQGFVAAEDQVEGLKREAERQQAFYTQNPGAHPETVTAESLDGGAE